MDKLVFNVQVFKQVDGSDKVGFLVRNREGHAYWGGTGYQDTQVAMNAAVERIRVHLGVIATLEDLRFEFHGVPAPEGYQAHV